MKNWKTTLGGFAAGLGLISSGIKIAMTGQIGEGAGMILAGAGAAWKGWHAQDAT